MTKLPPSSPISHKIVVGTLAVCAGMYAFWQVGKDYEFVKFEPHSKEEVERRKRDKVGLSIQHLDTRTLDYTPEAKDRMKREFEKIKEEKEKEK